MVDDCVSNFSADVERCSDEFPIAWSDVRAAKLFSKGLCVQYFDYNLPRIGAFCPFLVWSEARSLLELHTPRGVPNSFEWVECGDDTEPICEMATIESLSECLLPCNLSSVAKRSWTVATPTLLPKWKGPGTKWRLIINKSLSPCGLLHSVACRCIDVLLDNYPTEAWSDFGVPREFISYVLDFNHIA